MIDQETLNRFICRVDTAHQQFCVWVYTNNEFAKHQDDWNKIVGPKKCFTAEEFSREKDRKYKNFWSIVIFSLQCGWILSLARLFDLPYHSRDKKKEKPRLSLDYILELLNDASFAQLIHGKFKKHQQTIQSIKTLRDNFLAHNDMGFKGTKIKAGIEKLFEELGNAISDIKQSKKHLISCNNIDLRYGEILSRCGVSEIFEALWEKKG